MSRWLACLALLLSATSAIGESPPAPAPALSGLAAQSDLVALVQVVDTDYQYTRSFPSGGSAFLRVLIPYKVSRPFGELIQVYEEGLHENECYFPTPPMGEEGRRYLVFLRFNPDRPAQFLGLEAGCALDVLVTVDNGYALRWPVEGVSSVSIPEGQAQTLQFADRHAFVDDDGLSVDDRNRWLEAGWLRRLEDGRFVFTRGVPLDATRDMLGPENLTLDRSLLRPEEE